MIYIIDLCANPGWITDDAQKAALVEMLNRRVRALISCSTADGQADGSLSMEICGAGTSDFLARISAARKQQIELALQMMLVLKWTDTLLTAVQNYHHSTRTPTSRTCTFH